MTHPTPPAWNTGNHYSGLVVKIMAKDFARIGNCWMRNRLLNGDLAVCITHAGDNFWEYELLDVSSYFDEKRNVYQGYKRIMGSRFGAYVLGEPYVYQPTEEEFYSLMYGETTGFSGVVRGE